MVSSRRKKKYHIRYAKMIGDLSEITQMFPRERYLYRLMDTVIFHDFETALDVVIKNFNEAHNDNKKPEDGVGQ